MHNFTTIISRVFWGKEIGRRREDSIIEEVFLDATKGTMTLKKP